MKWITKNVDFLPFWKAKLKISNQAVFTLLTIFLFKSYPENPPSIAEGKRRTTAENTEKENALKSLKSFFKRLYEFLKNINFLMLMLAAGLLGGILFTIFTLLNQIVKSTVCDQSVRILLFLIDFFVYNTVQGRITLIFRTRMQLIWKFQSWALLWPYLAFLALSVLVLFWTAPRSSKSLWSLAHLVMLCYIFSLHLSIAMVTLKTTDRYQVF